MNLLRLLLSLGLLHVASSAILVAANASVAPQAPSAKKADAPAVPPTHANVPYGPHARQVLDVWLAPSTARTPAPVLFHIHGGGWVTGAHANV
eukprot:gene5549-7533_t